MHRECSSLFAYWLSKVGARRRKLQRASVNQRLASLSAVRALSYRMQTLTGLYSRMTKSSRVFRSLGATASESSKAN